MLVLVSVSKWTLFQLVYFFRYFLLQFFNSVYSINIKFGNTPITLHQKNEFKSVFSFSRLYVLNPFKHAGIYASHRFRGAYVRQVCINRNCMIYFLHFCMRLFNSIVKHHKIFQGKIQIKRKIIINRKTDFLHFWHKNIRN